jgi:threonine dehydrogenase-like Zn-dependent dehydrogenase
MKPDIDAAVSMISQHKVNVSKWITHKLTEDRIDKAMMMLIEKKEKAIGVEIVH